MYKEVISLRGVVIASTTLPNCLNKRVACCPYSLPRSACCFYGYYMLIAIICANMHALRIFLAQPHAQQARATKKSLLKKKDLEGKSAFDAREEEDCRAAAAGLITTTYHKTP